MKEGPPDTPPHASLHARTTTAGVEGKLPLLHFQSPCLCLLAKFHPLFLPKTCQLLLQPVLPVQLLAELSLLLLDLEGEVKGCFWFDMQI